MGEPVRGRVARILSSRELVINRGTDDGVSVGMRFAVLDPAGENIHDPATNEILGSLQRPKVQVEVTQAGPRISVAKTYRFSEVNVGGTGTSLGFLTMGSIARQLVPPRFEKRYETLKTKDANPEPLSEEESIVKVGDPVVEIREPGDDEVPGIISLDSGSDMPAASHEPDLGLGTSE